MAKTKTAPNKASDPVDNPTAPSPAHEKAVNTLGDAVAKADGVIGHSEILAVVNRKLIELAAG